MTVVRATTNRPELQMLYFEIEKQDDLVDIAATVVRQTHSRYFGDDKEARGIIFCQTKTQSVELGEILATPVCNSETKDLEWDAVAMKEGADVDELMGIVG